MSNTKRLKPRPRPPDETEAAFRAELRKGCPYCGSRTVTARFHDGNWDYGLRCEASCKTHTEPRRAHQIAAQAAERAAEATGQRLQYQAFGEGTGRVEGAVRALAGR